VLGNRTVHIVMECYTGRSIWTDPVERFK